MGDTTQAIIFFVGLALWTNAGDQGNRVILPPVHHMHLNATERMAAHKMNSDSQRITRSDDTPHVEDHVAAIITYADSFGTVKGWQAPLPIGNQTTFSYVPLNEPLTANGEHVKFLTEDSDQRHLTITANLPKLSREVTALNPAGATIFYVPFGSMKSCLSLTRRQTPRLDTKLELATNGTLTVSDLAETKSIQIKPHDGTIMLVVANIPKRYLQGDYSDPTNPLEKVPHVHAYYGVTNASCGNCVQTLKDWFLNNAEALEPCGSDVTLVGGRMMAPDCFNVSASEDTISGVMQGSNFMCSNEGWP